MAELGRPMKYTKEAFNKKVAEYFDYCDTKTMMIGDRVITKPYTISGLALFLDISRETLNNYEAIPDFLDTIKKAKTKIENYVEEMSLNGLLNPTVSIFNLKNNFGWKDKTEVETKASVTISNYKELTTEELKKLAGE
jgi:hypothetical protein